MLSGAFGLHNRNDCLTLLPTTAPAPMVYVKDWDVVVGDVALIGAELSSTAMGAWKVLNWAI